MKFNEYAKSIVAGLAAGVLMFFTLRTGGVTSDEWQVIVTSILTSAGITWAVPNKPQQPVNTVDIEMRSTTAPVPDPLRDIT